MKYPKKSFDKIIVLERENDEEWMLSQLFQDIVDPAYSYAFGTKEEVLRATGKEIVQHFKSIDWKPFIKERETIRQTVKKEFETNLTDYGIYEGVKPIFFTSVEHLGDRHWTETQLAKFFNVSTNRIQKAFVKQNVGATKWYAQKYLETKNCLRNN